MKIRALAAAAAAGLAAGAVVLAGSAQAANVVPVEPWKAYDSGTHDAADSHIVDPWTVNLVVDSENTNANAGTSLETADLGLDVADNAEITFEYESLEGADCNDGANVRVFVIIDGTQTNSWDQLQPMSEQCGEDGQVSFTVENGGTIQHAGLVYDNDPPAPGVIQFRNLTIDGEPVLFAEVCEWDDELGADSKKCMKPDPTGDPKPTGEPEPTEPAGEGGGELPDTSGVTAAVVLPIAGVVLLMTGGVALLVGRRRRLSDL